MRPDRFSVTKVEFCDGVYEVSCITNDWDKGDFDETVYFHLVNLEWEAKPT